MILCFAPGSVADPKNFGGGDFKNFKHKTSKIRMSSLKWRLIFRPKSEIRIFFPPKIRWSPKKKQKKKVFTEIETDFSEIQTFFPPKIRWSPKKKKKKKIFTEMETDFSAKIVRLRLVGGCTSKWTPIFRNGD